MCRFGLSLFGCWSGWQASGLVVLAWVDEQVAQDLAGGGVDHGDVEVLDEQDDVGSGVGSSDADVVELAQAAERSVQRLLAPSPAGWPWEHETAAQPPPHLRRRSGP